MSAALAFDLLLAVLIVVSALRALTTPRIGQALIAFVVFGLLMALAWVRLEAPDIALAEAAVGAGLSGVLLFDAWRALRDKPAVEER
jgi:energy-converting hydrogenase B subunit D